MEKIRIIILASMLLTVMLSGCSDIGDTDSGMPKNLAADNTVISDYQTEKLLSCRDIAEKILSFAEFSAMEEVSDEAMLSSIMDVTTGDIEEYCIYHNLISVSLQEIIVIRSNDIDATLAALEARKTTLIEQLAFYPEQKESAEATVVGNSGKICYLITHAEAKNIESKLIKLL